MQIELECSLRYTQIAVQYWQSMDLPTEVLLWIRINTSGSGAVSNPPASWYRTIMIGVYMTTGNSSYALDGEEDMNLFEKNAIFAFNTVVKPFIRFSPLTFVVLALTLLVMLGSAACSEELLLCGIVGFVGLPLVLGALAIILLPFTK